jgi:hypothetical protein
MPLSNVRKIFYVMLNSCLTEGMTEQVVLHNGIHQDIEKFQPGSVDKENGLPCVSLGG